jgi:hypothetical protein
MEHKGGREHAHGVFARYETVDVHVIGEIDIKDKSDTR